MKPSVTLISYAGLGIAILIFFALALIGSLSRIDLHEAIDTRTHSYQVLDAIRDLETLIKDAESSQRGYVITGDLSFLPPEKIALDRIDTTLASLRQLVAENPEQALRMGELIRLVRERLAIGEELIRLRKERGFDTTRTVIESGGTRDLMNRIRSIINEMVSYEAGRWQERSKGLLASYHLDTVIFNGGIALALFIIGAASTVLIRENRSRRRAERLLQELNEQLEQRVKDRTVDLRNAMEQLRISEERYATTLRGIGDAVISTDDRGRIAFMNSVAEALTGWNFPDAEGNDITTIFHIVNERTREPVENPVEKVLVIGKVVGLANHTVLIAKDGREIPIDDSGAPIRKADGTIAGVVLVFRDVAEERQAQLAIERQAQLIDLTPDAMIIRAIDGTISFWNPGAERLYQWTREEALGHTSHDILRTQFPASLEEINGSLLNTGRWEGELCHTRKDGTMATVYSRWLLRRDEHNTPQSIFESNVNITERKRLEQELEQRVEQRTRQLTETIRELETFSYSVSHDLRAPLRAINSFASIALEDFGASFEPECTRYLKDVIANARMMGRLVDELLTFSRLSREELRFSSIHTNALVRTIVEDLQGQQPPERVVEFQIGDLPGIYGSAPLLTQVFVNLIENALKYSSKNSETRIDISSYPQDDTFVFVVCDNGIGFDMRFADKLFGVFQRLHSDNDYPGTGIGLAMVKRIIERHGGQVWAEAAPNEGARFYFSLPARRKECATAATDTERR